MLFEKEEFEVWRRAIMMIVKFYMRHFKIVPAKPERAARTNEERFNR